MLLLAQETKPEEEEEEEEEDEEDAEEKAYRLEMQRVKEEREYNAMMKENPPLLQAVLAKFAKVEKKFLHIRKDALEQQVCACVCVCLCAMSCTSFIYISLAYTNPSSSLSPARRHASTSPATRTSSWSALCA